MGNIINTITGNVQLNTTYNTQDDLNSCGLTNWCMATDDEVSAYQQSPEYIKQQQVTDLTNKFLAAWDTYDLYSQIANENIKNAILVYIQAWDLTSLNALATSQYIPDNLKQFQYELATLLPTS